MDLRAEIKTIIYTNAENGFTVTKMRVRGETFPITAVGTIFNPNVGDALNMKGYWCVHKNSADNSGSLRTNRSCRLPGKE